MPTFARSLWLVSLVLTACHGAIGSEAGPGATSPSPSASATPTPTPSPSSAWRYRLGGQASALRRLSRDELLTTLASLTGTAPAREDLPREPRSASGPLHTTGVPFVAGDLPRLAEVLRVFADTAAPEVLRRSGCAQTGAAQRDCLSRFGADFAAEALRRPLVAGEAERLAPIFAEADGSPAQDTIAVSGLLRAVFFAPSFLYRSEIGTGTGTTTGPRPLSPSALAIRLSYFATLGPPDTALRRNAPRLSDPGVRGAEFERLIHTPAGQHALAVFILEWLGANDPMIHTKSRRYTGDQAATLEAAVRQSAEAVIIEALFGGAAGQATLAKLFEVKSYASDPALATVTASDTPETARQGLLMHPQVLSAHTKEDGVSPFQLGRFLRETLLCEPVAPPPANATAMALPDLPAGATLRENFQHKISAGPVCLSCHEQFAPLGYAFLPFDPVGRWLPKDPSGRGWDLSGSLETYSGTLRFVSHADLQTQLGARPEVQGCLAQAALEWAYGRGLVAADRPALDALDRVVKTSGGDVMAIFQAIVADPSFALAIGGK
ncbi:MAG: DUF1588 domain-containing protein [Myxococcota bacterium]